MKTKTFGEKPTSPEKKRSFEFTNYYTSVAETKTRLEEHGLQPQNFIKDNKKSGLPFKNSPKRKKNKLEPLDISHIDIEGPSLIATAKNTSLNESKLTSTPRSSGKDNTPKSIMKNKSSTNSEEQLDTSQYSQKKPKKRNKSVSFMLDDTEEVVVKKTKSSESLDRKQDTPKKQETSKDLNKQKKLKGNKRDVKGKENKIIDNVKSDSDVMEKVKKAKEDKNKIVNNTSKLEGAKEKKEQKKDKFKKVKKQNSEEKMEEDAVVGESNNNEDQTENKNRRAKKKKHSPKQTADTDGEPAAKSQKKEIKPEAIVDDLESLSIGDNAHTLTNLLDEMTVAEKDKRKKHKNKLKKAKKPSPSSSSSEKASTELENIEEGKEKVKWQKRKWNKDKKGVAEVDSKSSIIVDNLPLSIVCDYKKQLADHFKKHGEIKGIGVAEVYPAEDSKPVFTTSIQFCDEAAAVEALKEDNGVVCGGRVRVRLARPATETTLVVRSYGPLSDQSVSSAFAAAGRVRSIRHLVKGKKSIAAAFVEFDGPDALQNALKLAENVRIEGKKIHVSRFELRKKPKPAKAPVEAKEPDSEDSD
ncbi:high mobility group nucleosome-binding domain-containing protein 5-like [Ostrinia nubilalis]|uniref:high mobility group nucleosome-binding domain-containing protein 5-like n=1 Tax=Ostrinia nubilalis TaxID=29057 RepID=UPI0030823F0F